MSMIHPEVDQHIDAVRRICRAFGVRRLEVFGSATTARFDPLHSDVDLLVTYPEAYDFGPWIKRFFDLEHALIDELGRDIDLIMADAPRNPRFIAHINATKEVVYDEGTHSRAA